MLAFPAAVAALLQLTVAAAPQGLPADTAPPARPAIVTKTSASAPVPAFPAEAAPAPAAVGPRVALPRFDGQAAWTLEAAAVDTPQPRPRPRAIIHSDAYYTRLAIHRYASYAILPLFAGEWYVGQKVYNEEPQRSNLKGVHAVLGAGIFAAFAANTVTGVWNLLEARHDPGAARRTTHVVIMLLADAGFAATAATIPHRHRELGVPTIDQNRMNLHRDIAIGSIALGTVGSAIMWFWK